MAVGLRSRRGGHLRLLHMPWAEDVKYVLARRKQVVGNNPSVTAPPNRFRAHDGTSPCAPEFAQMREPVGKLVAECIICVVVKTIVFPKRVELARHLARPAAQSPKRGDVLITDFERLQRMRQGVVVILRIGARTRHGANVDQERHRDALQEFDELRKWPRAMTDGVKWVGHPILPAVPSRFAGGARHGTPIYKAPCWLLMASARRTFACNRSSGECVSTGFLRRSHNAPGRLFTRQHPELSCEPSRGRGLDENCH